GDRHRILGFALTDGTALDKVEVRIDDGPWRTAALEPQATKYSWKLFTLDWEGAAPGEHTLVSRATDVDGRQQPSEEEIQPKPTRWENNGLHPRTVRIG
ncbi:MAG: sulfite oxidase, partial [Thermoanaerobaculia bacterium]|nr:sulfite oxidase [Thermoanaerobaculia bacterium]